MNTNAMLVWGLAIICVFALALMFFNNANETKKEVYYETFVAENIYSEKDCLAKAKANVMSACKENLAQYLNCTDYWEASEVSYTPETYQCFVSVLLNREVKE